MSTDEIVAQVEEWETRHVVVTGGEPMLFAELIPLCARLRAIGRHITIETAGTLYLPVACDLMSISPKFATSAPSAARASALASAARARAASAGRDSAADQRVRVSIEVCRRFAGGLGACRVVSGRVSGDRSRTCAADAAGDRSRSSSRRERRGCGRFARRKDSCFARGSRSSGLGRCAVRDMNAWHFILLRACVIIGGFICGGAGRGGGDGGADRGAAGWRFGARQLARFDARAAGED